MPSFFRLSFFILSFLAFSVSSSPHRNRLPGLLQPHPHNALRRVSRRSCLPTPPTLTGSCFPALGFQMPSAVPANMDGWWCNPSDEYAFLGFSYEVTSCPTLAQLQKDFANIRNTFNSRYVRLYGVCDNLGFYNDIVTAAWDNTLGIHALVWCGFINCSALPARFTALSYILHTNPKAKFVTRVVQMGTEPLFDNVITPQALTTQVINAKNNLSDIGIPVTVSELAYGYQVRNSSGSQSVLDAIDSINAHMLPFFAADATTGQNAWPDVLNDLRYFMANGGGKKIYFDENGWPSAAHFGNIYPQSPTAVTSVSNEQAYFQLLDAHCQDLKAVPGGGVGWFLHIYSDSQEPGYGLYTVTGSLKFPFAPRTSC
ncbi:glycoside hydrolase superfamily [Russula earlei]|uniref:Glycoside hydrolase superfamily n=1 Tax=Russula earlei TaxID=71964 RepID=A0ACC0UF40_9AGAM|nr:glycoside hydrolase superfamily [Russula earlei]